MTDFTQKQRELERGVRDAKRESMLAQESGANKQAQQAIERARAFSKEYKRMSQATGLEMQKERMRVSGYKNKNVDIGGKSGIIKADNKSNKALFWSNSIYESAKNGERHSGIYIDAMKKSENQLLKSMKSHKEQVKEHIKKIEDRKSFDMDWDRKNSQQQKGLLKKWQKRCSKE